MFRGPGGLWRGKSCCVPLPIAVWRDTLETSNWYNIGANLVPNYPESVRPARPIVRSDRLVLLRIAQDRSGSSGPEVVRDQQVVGSIPTAGSVVFSNRIPAGTVSTCAGSASRMRKPARRGSY